MLSPGFDTLLLDAVQGADERRRDAALALLISFAERIARTRNPAHAESAAQSAVASVERRLSGGRVRFERVDELLSYLRRVAQGKAIDRVREDRRHLGSPEPEADVQRIGRESVASVGHSFDSQLAGEMRRLLQSFPKVLQPLLSERMIFDLGAGEQEERARAHQARRQAEEIALAINRVFALFPEQLRDRAAHRLATGPAKDLDGVLLEMEGRLLAARELSNRDRLVIEMREAGWEPIEIAERLGMTAGNVRVIHHRLCTRLFAERQEHDHAG